MRKPAILMLLLLVISLHSLVSAQPVEQLIKIVVAPDHSSWTYKIGEPVKFSIAVLQDGNPVKNATVLYEIGPEKMPPVKKDSILLADGKIILDGGTMKTAGFIRCAVVAKFNGKEYRRIATAGFDPLSIQPTVTDPADFDAFWSNAKDELAKVPLGTKMTLMPERCTENVDVYHVSIQNITGAIYGILCLPKKPGKYPALLRVPGAGVRGYGGNIAMAEKGMITLEIGIHGIPVNLDPSVYSSLGSAALSGYTNYNLDNRDRFYFKKVYLGCVRANDLLVSLPQYDGSTLAVTGGSQGGALSIVTAALDSRVKYLAAYYPALADVTGYLHGRAGGWPHYFDKNNAPFNNKKDKIETICYYDVVNFSRRVNIPGIYSWGYNDEVCPPTSMYASYNVITAPKTIFLVPETGHWTYPEQGETLNNWLIEKMNLKPSR